MPSPSAASATSAPAQRGLHDRRGRSGRRTAPTVLATSHQPRRRGRGRPRARPPRRRDHGAPFHRGCGGARRAPARYAARVASLEPAADEPGRRAAERAGADAPSAPSRCGKRGQQVRKWLERRGRRAVRPRWSQVRIGSPIRDPELRGPKPRRPEAPSRISAGVERAAAPHGQPVVDRTTRGSTCRSLPAALPGFLESLRAPATLDRPPKPTVP